MSDDKSNTDFPNRSPANAGASCGDLSDPKGPRFGDEEFETLVFDTTLTSLDLTGDDITMKRLKTLVHNTTLRSLVLDWNIIRDDSAQVLSLNTTLTSIDLWNNNISENGARALALNTTLTRLHLGSNMIGDGAKAFALNTTLTKLYLWSNQISDNVADELALNTTLTFLDLEDNKITDKGAHAFCHNTSLTYLNLRRNFISEKWMEKVEDRIKLNRQHLQERRSYFIRCIIVLVRDASNYESDSSWRRLIPDMRRYIINQMCHSWQLGVTIKEARELSLSIFRDITCINEALRKGIPLIIVQKEDMITIKIPE